MAGAGGGRGGAAFPFRVLYLFAGSGRHAEVATFLEKLYQEWGELEETTIVLAIVEVDTERRRRAKPARG